MNTPLDLTGKTFGRLTVNRYSHSDGFKYWECVCRCGKVTVVKGRDLRAGKTKSCGCLSIEQCIKNFSPFIELKKIKHNFPKSLISCYSHMVNRCYNPKDKCYDIYGGRGIKVCRLWLNDCRSFYKWLSDRGYRPGLQIDRINNNKGYFPSNCRVVTPIVQQNNKNNNHRITWKNKTLTITEWSRHLGVDKNAFRGRINSGWSLSKVFNQPYRKSSPRK